MLKNVKCMLTTLNYICNIVYQSFWRFRKKKPPGFFHMRLSLILSNSLNFWQPFTSVSWAKVLLIDSVLSVIMISVTLKEMISLIITTTIISLFHSTIFLKLLYSSFTWLSHFTHSILSAFFCDSTNTGSL